MANYRAVSTGVWSALARWQDDSSGSYVASTVLPSAADVVYANNFTVTLDIDITVSELRNNAATNVTAGGTFTFGAATTVIANIFGNVNNVGCVTNNVSAVIKYIIGNCTGGANGNSIGVYSYAQTIITGNAIGGTSLGGNGVRCDAGTITINGNVLASGFGYGAQVRSTSSATLIINGTSTGSATANIPGTFSEFSSSNCIVNTAVAQTGPGVGISSSGQVIVKNIVMSSSGVFGVTGGAFRFDNTGPNSVTVTLQNGTQQTLVDATIGFPSSSDVRNGVSYASGTLTGTLVVPSANTVSLGVVYDNGTVGTAANTAAAFLSELSSSSDPLAIRLKNVSTVDSTAATVAAFKV